MEEVMCVLPTSWVVYFLAGLTFLLTWLFFALLNIMSPTLMFTTIDHVDHHNHSNHLDHRNQISQTHASTGINLLHVLNHQSRFDRNDHHGNPQPQVLASLLLVSDQPGWAGAVFGWIFAGFLVAVIAVIIGRWEVTH